MPTTTELKLSNNCWHSLCYQYSFLSTRAFHFYSEFRKQMRKLAQCCNALSLGLFISTYQKVESKQNHYTVAMPCLLGFSFLRYPSETSVKSILSRIISASNSQNILNFIIFLSVFGFPFFIDISIYQFLNLFNTFFCFSQKYQAVPVSELLNSNWIYFHILSLFFYRIHHYKYHIL